MSPIEVCHIIRGLLLWLLIYQRFDLFLHNLMIFIYLLLTVFVDNRTLSCLSSRQLLLYSREHRGSQDLLLFLTRRGAYTPSQAQQSQARAQGGACASETVCAGTWLCAMLSVSFAGRNTTRAMNKHVYVVT